jgi:hypothetical protein
MALTLVVYESALILLTVLPSQNSFTVHFILEPVTSIRLTIRPVVFSISANFVLKELAFVIATISES